MAKYMEGAKKETQQPTKAAGSDISALIAEEVADIKSGTGQPLTWHKTNITGLLYLALDASAGKALPVRPTSYTSAQTRTVPVHGQSA